MGCSKPLIVENDKKTKCLAHNALAIFSLTFDPQKLVNNKRIWKDVKLSACITDGWDVWADINRRGGDSEGCDQQQGFHDLCVVLRPIALGDASSVRMSVTMRVLMEVVEVGHENNRWGKGLGSGWIWMEMVSLGRKKRRRVKYTWHNPRNFFGDLCYARRV